MSERKIHLHVGPSLEITDGGLLDYEDVCEEPKDCHRKHFVLTVEVDDGGELCSDFGEATDEEGKTASVHF